jgi:hypothetical protein
VASPKKLFVIVPMFARSLRSLHIGVDAFDHVNMATLPEIMGTFSENSTAMLFLDGYAFSRKSIFS